MFNSVRIFLTTVALAVSVSTAQAKEEVVTLTQVLADASRHKQYEPVSVAELRQAEKLFLATFVASESFSELKRRWSDLGWNYRQLVNASGSDSGTAVYLLTESPSDIRGRGCYAFRHNAELPVAIQAPHSFYDKHTRSIGIRIFEQGSARAASWNTVRRSVEDAAHVRDTYFNAFTRAFLQIDSRMAIVQLHGFAQEKRKTLSGRASDIIVSNGTRFPGRLARSAAAQLASGDLGAVHLYPSQVKELGGTKNAQASIVHQHGFDNFIHIEMSADIRKSLCNRKNLRDQFSTQLFSSLSIFLADSN